MKVSLRIFGLAILLLIFVFSCAEDEKPTEPNGSGEPPVYTNGEGEIGEIGGTISVSDPNSPIYGASIEIPEGALESEINFSLSDVESENYQIGREQSIKFLEINPSGVEFNQPVIISIPWTKENINNSDMGAYYFDPVNKKVEELEIVNLDIENKVTLANIKHTSLYFSDDENNITIDIELVNLHGFIAAYSIIRTPFESIDPINDNLFVSYNSAMDILKEVGDYKAVRFEATLKKGGIFSTELDQAEIIVMKNKPGGFESISADIYKKQSDGNFLYLPLFRENDVSYDELGNVWMSGFPFLFIFENYTPNSSDKYYVTIGWQFFRTDDVSTFAVNDEYTEYYEFGTNSEKKLFQELSVETRDADTSGILDMYETGSDNSPPDAPSNPAPSDNATNVSTTPTLSWICSDPDGDPLTYDVYFGTSSNPSLAQSSQSLTSYSPGELNENTTYYWKIIAEDDKGLTTEGDIWSFETGESGGGGMGEPCPGVEKVYYEGGPNSDGGGDYYNTVQIGAQCWLKENLDVGTRIDVSSAMTDNGILEKYCYGDDLSNCVTNGGLYQWDEVMQYSLTEGSKGICPPGWHIPTKNEFEALKSIVNNDGNILKAEGEGSGSGIGTNESGFSALLGGRVYTPGYSDYFNAITNFWSSTEFSSNFAVYSMSLLATGSSIGINGIDKADGVSVRCILGGPDNFAPNKPSNPTPSDNATNVSTTPTLSWNCSDPDGDPLKYDIYFGTSSSPSLVQSSQSSTSYNPGQLNENTTYYWKIIVEDDEGLTAEGDVWSFTTGSSNTPPIEPSSPDPIDGSINVDLNTTLSWECSDPDGHTLLYDIYLGTNSNPQLVQENQAIDSYNTINLLENTTYYWKIKAKDQYGGETFGPIWTFTTKSEPFINPQMVYVEGGSFQMGDNFGDGQNDEYPVHTVILDDFYIGKYEITQKEWNTYMQSNPSANLGDNRPVENITWYEAAEYCNKKSDSEGLEKFYTISGSSVTMDWNASGYRLPTEAEWEFAARGGSFSNNNKYSGSNNVDDVAWYDLPLGSQTQFVGGKTGNELQLFDMSGNVYELCNDWYDENYYNNSPTENPKGPSNGTVRVIRGGCITTPSTTCRVSFRIYQDPLIKVSTTGFRIVRSAEGGGGGDMGERCPEIPTVPYAGKTYNTVQIGEQCWIKENLNVGIIIEIHDEGHLQTDNSLIEKYCYNNDPINCEVYGGLYEWNEAMQYIRTEGSQGICPNGWHIPTIEEFETLEDYVNDEAAKLVDEGQSTYGYTPTNETGFSALFAGFHRSSNSNFDDFGENTFFQSSTESNTFYASTMILKHNSNQVIFINNSKTYGFSVRCLQD